MVFTCHCRRSGNRLSNADRRHEDAYLQYDNHSCEEDCISRVDYCHNDDYHREKDDRRAFSGRCHADYDSRLSASVMGTYWPFRKQGTITISTAIFEVISKTIMRPLWRNIYLFFAQGRRQGRLWSFRNHKDGVRSTRLQVMALSVLRDVSSQYCQHSNS